MSTIRDVAQAAGVSVATVSRALRGVDRVRPQTREKIQRLAAELDFVASPTAASLASGRTRVIAVVAPSRTRWSFATLVRGIDRTLRLHDHMVFLVDLEDEGDNPRRRLSQAMLLKRVDGVIALNVPVDEGELEVLDRLDLPLVAVGTPVPGRSLIRIDDVLTARVATEHLIGLGHTRIAFVGSMPDDIGQAQAPFQRLHGFRETVANHGLSCPPHFIMDAGWTALSASRAVTELLQAPDRPTAVMATSDEMAMGVLQTARRLGLRIPRDLSVIGIDDHVLSEVMDLTTMRHGWSAATKDLGLEGLTPHDLRRTFGSLARAAGADLRWIQRAMGHESINTTARIYAHLYDDELDIVAAALDELNSRASGVDRA